jgi:beta-glucanase (GH16 family)
MNVKSFAQSYELAWADEFNGQRQLDPEKWTFEKGYVRNDEKQFYTDRPENCRIENGKLVIEAIREPYEGYDYTSASVTTQNRKAFLYGRIEVKAKLPTGRGAWPAIWMLGTNIEEVGWPMCGEIDIMENVGYDPNKVHGNIHTKAFNHNLGTNKGEEIKCKTTSKEYHVYAINWTPEKIEFFLDDEKYFTFLNDLRGDPETWPFDQPHYLLLNLAIGGFWGGKKGIDDKIFPQKYEIDYVRYYTLADE